MLRVNDYISSYRQDRHKIWTTANCLWDQGTIIFKFNTVACYRKSERKMVAAQSGNTYISACTLDRNTIPNPKSMFSTTDGLFNGDTLNPVPCYRTSEHKMAAAQTGNTYISACTLDRNTIPNPNPMFSITQKSYRSCFRAIPNANVGGDRTTFSKLWQRNYCTDPRLVAISPYFKRSVIYLHSLLHHLSVLQAHCTLLYRTKRFGDKTKVESRLLEVCMTLQHVRTWLATKML